MSEKEEQRLVANGLAHEVICKECGKSFISVDSNAIICDDCWEKQMKEILSGEGKGE